MRIVLRLAVLFSCLAPTFGRAEYRAYRIGVRDETTGVERSVVSTLDPIQYAGYFPLKRNESTRLASTWRCRKRSDWFTPICPPPAPRALPGAKSK